VTELAQAVARSADAADLHAPVPALLIELSTILGTLTATVTAVTERGRRPFRPTQDFTERLGELAYSVFLLADQSGVDVTAAALATARGIEARAVRARATEADGWPVQAGEGQHR
jgi:hypothetical protein